MDHHFMPELIKITGYGSGPDTCLLRSYPYGSWIYGRVAGAVQVECFDTSGNPVDALFTLSYSSLMIRVC